MTGMRAVLRGLALAAAVLLAPVPAPAVDITLTPISSPFTNPIGIDYHEPTNSLVISANYSTGLPHNFERIEFNGSHVQFSNASGFTDEVKIATVRSGGFNGGFTVGDLFTGNGVDGQIARITNGGGTVQSPWVDLGPGNGLMRGSLYIDRTGVFGGDLIVVTTGGSVWRVTSAGVATFLKDVDTHLEGVLTVPNDPSRYGPLAGRIIAGAEQQGLLYSFGPNPSDPFVTFDVNVNVEDIDLILADHNFFGVNFGIAQILSAPASDFAGIVDDILLTQEGLTGPTGLYRLFWDGSSLQAQELGLGLGSTAPGQWEHVTFAPVPPPGLPAPSTLVLLGAGLAALGALARRR